MTFLLGIDAGTTALKSVLFDIEGNVIASGSQEYSIIQPTPTIAEQEADSYWQAIRNSVKVVLAKSGVDPKEIVSLAVSSQGETFVPLDKDGAPLRHAIVWLDNRSQEECELIKREFSEEKVFKTTGQTKVVPTWTAPKIIWLKRNEPKVFEKAYKYLLLEDYLIYKLTGQFVTEYSVVCSTIMFNIESRKWWSEMLDFIGISEGQLPVLKPPGEAISNITDEASKEIGLSPSTLVSTGGYDHAAGAIGAGNIKPGIATETTGSALALVATINGIRYDPKRRVPTHHHAVGDLYFLSPWSQTAGMVLRWFRDKFGDIERTNAKRLGVDAYDLLGLEASKVPPGSEGLVILPHLMGAACPEFDPLARGVIFGITLSHSKGNFVRAIMESIAYMLRRHIELLDDLDVKVNEIRSLGGASRSRLWNQIKADVTKRPIITFKGQEAASLGAAILAGKAEGTFKTVEEGCESMVHMQEIYEPKKENESTYDRLYDIYVNLYISLRDLFPKLNLYQAG